MPEQPDRSVLTYRDAGVDVDLGNQLVERLKPLARATATAGVVGGLGGFGALFELPLDRYRAPLLVASTDGVGTKLRLAIEAGRHDGVGIDLVAMCVNDVLTLGAEPLFFLDYYASGHLELETATAVVAGIAAGCREAGAALIGGETAEMPGMYRDRDYDLAGFCVGIVERDGVVDGSRIAPGHQLLGLASSGLHSNGYSLVRAILDRGSEPVAVALAAPFGPATLGEALLAPTRIYAASVLGALAAGVPILGAAHITGGGLVENVARILPPGTAAILDAASWPRPAVFDWVQESGGLDEREMHRTFNCGLGMVLCVAAEDVDRACAELQHRGETVFRVGSVESRTEERAPRVRIHAHAPGSDSDRGKR